MKKMQIEWIPITKENASKAVQLSIKPEQTGMVESVEECLREASKLPLWRPVAISADGMWVGFAMYGLWKNEGASGRVWLDRFLIDARHQGKGYAKASLSALLPHIKKTYGCDRIYLSVYQSNFAAIRLYESFGFSFNGETDINGEQVMVLCMDEISDRKADE